MLREIILARKFASWYLPTHRLLYHS